MEKELSVKFEHLRKPDSRIYATICRIASDKKSAYGIAILGDHDNLNRKEGRRRSLGRAKRAFYTNKNDLPIRMKERENVTYFLENFQYAREFPYKSFCIKY
jgi:hypothetical protein